VGFRLTAFNGVESCCPLSKKKGGQAIPAWAQAPGHRPGSCASAYVSPVLTSQALALLMLAARTPILVLYWILARRFGLLSAAS
jgi:hypothetical protein